MAFNFRSFGENPDQNNQDPTFLRKKHGIDEQTRAVDYSFVSKIDNLNLEPAKPYLAIAFECGEFEIATCLAEISPYIKYLYIPNNKKRTTLATETNNPNIQLCLAQDKNDEVLKGLIANPNLPKNFVRQFTLFDVITDTIWNRESNNREELIEAIWRNPKSNPNILVKFLENQLISENSKITSNSEFREQVFANQFFTPEFLDNLYQSYAPNIRDFVIIKTRLQIREIIQI